MLKRAPNTPKYKHKEIHCGKLASQAIKIVVVYSCFFSSVVTFVGCRKGTFAQGIQGLDHIASRLIAATREAKLRHSMDIEATYCFK